MPLIDFSYPAGTFESDTLAALLDELAGTMLHWEGAPDNEFFRSITWVYPNERAPVVGGRAVGEARFRIDVTFPAGALSDRRKAGLVEGLTAAVLRAAGLEAAEAGRVWVLLNEVPDGNWGAGGAVIRLAQLAEAAKAGRAEAAASAG